MKTFVAWLALLLLCLPLQAQDTFTARPECENVEESVLVLSGGGAGSGVVYKNGKNTFVWTAAHVVRNSLDCSPNGVRYFRDVWVSHPVIQDGRKVGENRRIARIVRFDESHDICLLHIRQRDWLAKSVRFIPDKVVPTVGKSIWHVGSFNGSMGECSVSSGEISAIGRLRKDSLPNELNSPVVCDQVSIVAHHGSSGGGIFYKESGECIGLLNEFLQVGTHGSFCITPTRRLYEFARKNDCVWAMTDDIASPEDITVVFDEVFVPPPAPQPQPIPKKQDKIEDIVVIIVKSIIKAFEVKK